MLLGVLLLLVFAFALSWTFIILGLLVRSPNAVMGVSMMVLMPLTFASNVFVDPATMPSGLRAFVNVNPVSHLVTAERSLMAGSPDTTEIVWVLIASVVLTAVLGPIAMRIYRNKT